MATLKPNKDAMAALLVPEMLATDLAEYLVRLTCRVFGTFIMYFFFHTCRSEKEYPFGRRTTFRELLSA
jgi:hypothetical protein